MHAHTHALTTNIEVIVSCGNDVGTGRIRRLAGGHSVGEGGTDGATVGWACADARHADAQAPHCNQLVVGVSQVSYGQQHKSKRDKPIFPFTFISLLCDVHILTFRTSLVQSDSFTLHK